VKLSDIDSNHQCVNLLNYIFQLQGQTQEAMGTYVHMTKEKSADPSSRAVASTNLISLKGTKDAADNLRKLDRLIEKSTAPNQLQLVESLDFKLSPRQKESLYSARVLLLLHENKTDQVCLCKSDKHLSLFSRLGLSERLSTYGSFLVWAIPSCIFFSVQVYY
jgi:hypothetical protein